MPPSKRSELLKRIDDVEAMAGYWAQMADESHYRSDVAKWRSQIETLQAKIDKRHEEYRTGAAKAVKCREAAERLKKELAEHDNRHDIERLLKAVKGLTDAGSA